MIRLFLFCNGNNYGSPKNWGPKKPDWDTGNRTLRDYVSNNYYEFDPPDPLDPQFSTDLKQVLDIFQALKQKGKPLQLIPVLLDFSFGEYGKVAIFMDQNKQTKFLNTVFDPLLNLSKPYMDLIYAWDVMNEPTWMLRKISPPLKFYGTVPILDDASMTTFLNAAIKRIEAAGFQSTVGHRYFADLSKLPTGSKPQFHYYSKYIAGDDDRTFPVHTGSPDAFVGEIDATPKVFGDTWSDCLQLAPYNQRDEYAKDCVFERLAVLARKGYSLALLWPFANDPATDPHLNQEGQDGLKRFTTGLYPNGIPAVTRTP